MPDPLPPRKGSRSAELPSTSRPALTGTQPQQRIATAVTNFPVHNVTPTTQTDNRLAVMAAHEANGVHPDQGHMTAAVNAVRGQAAPIEGDERRGMAAITRQFDAETGKLRLPPRRK